MSYAAKSSIENAGFPEGADGYVRSLNPEEFILDWSSIDVAFLDMDGTLLDLHFDDYFWREHVPQRFAEKHGISFEQARQHLFERYRDMQGTLEWYCLDYWSRELDLNIPVLKDEVRNLIAVHPHVPEFLDIIRELGKKAVLVTNAHGKSLALKMKQTRLREKLDGLVCAHDLGLPKEDPAFWRRLETVVPFEKRRTLLVDDSIDVLDSARQYGIRYLVSIVRPNTRRPPRAIEQYPSIQSFRELFP
jgi:HAD superfamily hydrolase (TIGR01509 family)